MFKDRLREARKKAGYSQEALGQLVGLRKQTISDYERGYSEPDMKAITDLMHHLQVDANYLWQDEMDISDQSEIFSTKALEVARAYVEMSDYGRAIIDCVMKQEKKP